MRGAPTKSGKPCERTVEAPGQRCRDHDPSLLKCDGKTTANKPCGKPAVDGLTKCAAHAKKFIKDGGDPDALKRADFGNAAALQAGMQAMQALAKDDRIVGDTGATNHTARPGDVVAPLPGTTVCETNGGLIPASRGLTHVPFESDPQPAVVLNGPRCASIGKLTRKNTTGLPRRLSTMASGEAGFINEPALAAEFLRAAKRSGA